MSGFDASLHDVPAIFMRDVLKLYKRVRQHFGRKKINGRKNLKNNFLVYDGVWFLLIEKSSADLTGNLMDNLGRNNKGLLSGNDICDDSMLIQNI